MRGGLFSVDTDVQTQHFFVKTTSMVAIQKVGFTVKLKRFITIKTHLYLHTA